MRSNCNVCNSKNVVFFLESNNIHGYSNLNAEEKFKVFRCKKCGNIFLPGIAVNDRYYKKYYLEDYYTVEFRNKLFTFLVKFVDTISYLMKQRIILNNSNEKRRIRLLDIGCGTGGFLSRLSDTRFEMSGIEVNKNAVSVAKEKGLNVEVGDFLKSKRSGTYDVITMWQVLEHLNEPQRAVQKVYKMLGKGGLFVFGVPNSDALGFKIGGKFWYHLDSPRHLFIPNEQNLRALLKKNKFRVESIISEFYDYPLDLFYSVKRSRLKFLIYPLYPLIKLFDKEVLTVVARKI